MDQATAIIIRELADKLGTTANHLWAVLIKQAPISGVCDLFFCAFLVYVVFAGFKLVKRKTTKESDDVYPDWCEEGAVFAWFGWGVLAVISALVVGCGMSTTIAAFTNPEYWALMHLLSACGG